MNTCRDACARESDSEQQSPPWMVEIWTPIPNREEGRCRERERERASVYIYSSKWYLGITAVSLLLLSHVISLVSLSCGPGTSSSCKAAPLENDFAVEEISASTGRENLAEIYHLVHAYMRALILCTAVKDRSCICIAVLCGCTYPLSFVEHMQHNQFGYPVWPQDQQQQ